MDIRVINNMIKIRNIPIKIGTRYSYDGETFIVKRILFNGFRYTIEAINEDYRYDYFHINSVHAGRIKFLNKYEMLSKKVIL